MISIHAPAWGATGNGRYYMARICISIHAPAWGATGGQELLLFLFTDFNPRSRMGSDYLEAANKNIHDKNFNPRSRMGSDGRHWKL